MKNIKVKIELESAGILLARRIWLRHLQLWGRQP